MRKFLATIIFSSLAFVDAHATTTTLSSGTLSQNIILGSGDIVNFNGGSLNGAITPSPDNSGTVNFNSNTILGGNIGITSDGDRGSGRVGTINIADGITVSTGSSNDIGAQELILGNGSTLNYQFGYSAMPYSYLNGVIRGSSDGYGDIEFSGGRTYFVGGSLGTSTHKLNKITILGGGMQTTGMSPKIHANSILIQQNVSLSIPSESSEFEFVTINPITSNSGTIYFDGTRTLSSGQSLGNERAFQSLSVQVGTITSNANISTNTLSIANNATFNQASGTLTANLIQLNDGNSKFTYSGGTISAPISGSGYFEIASDFTSDSTLGLYVPLRIDVLANKTLTSGGTISASNINLASGAKFKYSSGTISGTLRGTSNGVGIFEVDANYNGGLNIGSSGSALASVLINSGKTLTLNGDIYATNTTVNGTLNFGSSARRINGNLTSAASKTLGLGSHTNTVVGDVTIGANNTINTEIGDTNNIGGITAIGTQTIGASPTINITLDTGAHIANGSTFTLFSGASGSSFSAINDSVLNVNSSGTNQADRFTFNTSQVGNSIILTINSVVTPIVVTKPAAVDSYGLLASIGGGAVDGNLRIFKGYLENNSVSTADKEVALARATPQVDNSTNISALNNAKAGMRVIETRLESTRGLASGDELKNRGMWFKTFGSSINQGDIGADDGYKAKTAGFGFGLDNEFIENTILGLSLNFANANIKSNLDTKETAVETYQLNFYGSYNYEKYFLDGIAGFAWNRYNSSRTVPVVAANAKANFDGQTYVAKIRGGVEENLGNGFAIIPGLGLTYAHNTVDQYNEEGAGTMNLRVKNGSYNFLEARGSIKLKYEKKLESGTRISPDVRISYGHDFLGQRQSTSSNFTGHVGTFSSRGAKVYKNSVIVGAGLNIFRTDNIAIETNYNYEHKKEYNAHGADVKVRYDF